MVTLASAENALKSVYLGVVANQLNVSANPLLSKIKRTNKDVWGKEIIKLAPYGLNGGVGAGTETATLPAAGGNSYAQFRATLKNLYGRIEISDKAIRASQNNAGAFVNLLSDEMEGLVKASMFNLGRMLYSDGTGLLGKTVSISSKELTCDKVNNIMEGMLIDLYTDDGTMINTKCKVLHVDRFNKKVIIDKNIPYNDKFCIYNQGSRNNEITGIGALFANTESIYGLKRADYKWLTPFQSTDATEISDNLIQTAIDFLDENADSKINYITCSSAVRRAYQSYLTAYRTNVDIMNLEGGFKAISYNGIPVVADRFVDEGTMYLLNTDDFTMHELCDWKWIEGENGSILKQTSGQPVYTATLVKYAELICDKPYGQAKISGISSTVQNPFANTFNCSCNCAPATSEEGETE